MKGLAVLFATNSADDLTFNPKPRFVFDNPELAHADHIACAECQAEITRACMRIAVGGHHRHIFPMVKEVDQECGCFSLAPGCRLVGHFKLDFTGIDNGVWEGAFCATCGAHLGWHYQLPSGMGFFCLILDHLLALGPDGPDEKA